ncbi:unnamed protein product [Durusdinium trenchii]|uniref:Uncharacterized protein n=1 Tax=Durusdinium trenchii TaxID=1381693 RepID=A0ABP0SJQ1_9DINO
MECWNSGAALAFAYGEKADQRRESRFSFSSIMGEWSSSFAVGHPICFCHKQRWYDAHEDREEDPLRLANMILVANWSLEDYLAWQDNLNKAAWQRQRSYMQADGATEHRACVSSEKYPKSIGNAGKKAAKRAACQDEQQVKLAQTNDMQASQARVEDMLSEPRVQILILGSLEEDFTTAVHLDLQEPLPGEDPAFVKPAEEEEAKVGALVQDHTMPNPVNPMHPL